MYCAITHTIRTYRRNQSHLNIEGLRAAALGHTVAQREDGGGAGGLKATTNMTTLRDATNQWLLDRAARRELAPSTIPGYRAHLGDFCESVGPDRQVDDVTAEDFSAWLATSRNKRTGQPYSPTTLNTRAATVRAFYHDLAKRGIVMRDPTITVQRAKVGDHLPRAASETDIQRMLDLADIRARTMILLMLHAGLRRFEVAKLRIEDWNPDNGTISVVGKGNYEAVVPVSHELAMALSMWIAIQPRRSTVGPMFPSSKRKGQPIASRTVNAIFQKLSEQAGLSVVPHSLRHSCATNLLADGVPANAAMQILRHRTLASTQVYTRLNADDLQRYVGRRSFMDTVGPGELEAPASGGVRRRRRPRRAV